jgi:ABC-type lipoprotein release transport system permease subunit
MRALLAVAATGVSAVLLHPLRSLVTIAALLAVLLPYTAGVALSRGLQAEAEASLRFGADLYVTGDQFGRDVPIPLEAADALRHLDGVQDAVPRIVGDVVLGKEGEHAVLVGLPLERLPAAVACVDGRLPRPGAGPNELVLGTDLARRLALKVGDTMYPFYHNDKGERLSRVVGLFKADAPPWQARMIFTSFDTAAAIFNQSGLATDVLVTCREGAEAEVAHAIPYAVRFPAVPGRGGLRAKVTSRQELAALLPGGLLHREGVFNLYFVLAFVVGILVVLVTSGVGLSERRREVAVLKATGWQTDEVLLRGLVESFLLALAGAALAVVLAWVWLRGLNGFGLAAVFLGGADAAPVLRVPCLLTPVPALLALVVSFAVVLTGTLFSTWRAATAPPFEAMR